MWMRGGTSKGGYFLAEDLPGGSGGDPAARDAFLLRAFGSPDSRQIDGMGGGDPLTSKVAIVTTSDRPDVDVEYLFLQVFVDRAVVSDAQNCGNILAGVGPFAIERGLVAARDGHTPISILMKNSGQVADVVVDTPGGVVRYDGPAQIDGVPGTAAPISVAFRDTAGAMCGALLPSGNARDVVAGMSVTMIDAGMPCVLIRAEDFGISGNEEPGVLETDTVLKTRIESLRLVCGELMNLGDVTDSSVPKMTLISPPQSGAISTRSFIPHRVHSGIGVLAAVSVATACVTPGSVVYEIAKCDAKDSQDLGIEHPTGTTTVKITRKDGTLRQAAILRTARKLMDGEVFA